MFLMVRPMTDGVISMTYLKAAAISTAISWAAVFVALGGMHFLGRFSRGGTQCVRSSRMQGRHRDWIDIRDMAHVRGQSLLRAIRQPIACRRAGSDCSWRSTLG